MPKIQILVVDDEPDILQLLKISLNRMGLTVYTAATIGAAKVELDKVSFHFCLTDMKLPDGNGIELVEYVNEKYPNTPIAIVTAYGTISHAVNALKKGAFDFITKPISIQVLRNLVANAINQSGSTENKGGSTGPTQIMGSSDYIKAINTKISKLSKSQSYVYIEGPKGTSKKLIAHCIHNLSQRSDEQFYSFDCHDKHQDLSDLFGDDKTKGLLADANNSTLYLENIEYLSLPNQEKLYHILIKKQLPSHTDEIINLDIRLITSSNNSIKTRISQGDFNQTLFDRISIIDINTLELSQHGEDIPVLAKEILNKYSKQWQQLPCKIDSQALHKLCQYDFPGNMLELKLILEKAATLCDNNIIRESDLGFDEEETQPTLISQRHDKNLEEYIEEIEIQEITKALELTNNNKTAAARVLGISFRALRYRVKKLGLD
jgi:two-component system response regulator PilR (NtrC family)